MRAVTSSPMKKELDFTHMPLYIIEFPTPKGCWSDLTRNYDVTATMISFAWVEYRRYIALVKIEGKDAQEFLRRVEKCSSTKEVSLYSKNSTSIVFEVRATRVLPLHIFASAEIFMLSPITIEKGIVTAKLLSKSKLLSVFLDLLRKVEYPFRIYKDRSNEARPDGLTRKQKHIMKKAVQYGYYNYPRRITLTELAGKLDVSKSYLSQTFQIIESRLIGKSVN